MWRTSLVTVLYGTSMPMNSYHFIHDYRLSGTNLTANVSSPLTISHLQSILNPYGPSKAWFMFSWRSLELLRNCSFPFFLVTCQTDTSALTFHLRSVSYQVSAKKNGAIFVHGGNGSTSLHRALNRRCGNSLQV